jgi:vacuolar protein sorting-associated protein 53
MSASQRDEDKSSLSSPNYDPLIHLNEIFPDPSSLSSLPAIQLHLSAHLGQIDKEIEIATLAQRQQQSSTREQITQLQLELEDLFKDVQAVKDKAEKADGVMSGLTDGIRRLDMGKQNLTISMTALKRLQMLSIPHSIVISAEKNKQRHTNNSLYTARHDNIRKQPNFFKYAIYRIYDGHILIARRCSN